MESSHPSNGPGNRLGVSHAPTIPTQAYASEGRRFQEKLARAFTSEDRAPRTRCSPLRVVGICCAGLQWSKRTESDDPDGDPLDNLNHVYTVLVDKLDGGGKEVWLPCGFRGDDIPSSILKPFFK